MLDELQFLSSVKARPGMYFGRKSLLGLRDLLCGMELGANVLKDENEPRVTLFPLFFKGFVPWYLERFVKDQNGYAAWWNHLLYISGNHDDCAFDSCFRYFEKYLNEERPPET